MEDPGSPMRRSSMRLRNAVDDDLGEANMLAARLAQGEDPQLIWSAKPLGRRTCEELAELEPATLCLAVSLNSHTHPTLAALVGARALKEAAHAQRGRNAGVAGKLAALSTKLEQFAVGLLRSLPPVTVRTLLLRGAGDDNDIFASSSHAHFRGRSLLDVAVALDNKLFLSSPEARLVLDHAWLGRAVRVAGDDEEEDAVAVATPHKSPASGPLARLAAARSAQPHSRRWRLLWPPVAAVFLPLVALVPPQALSEAIFTPLYSPAERYWTAALLYCGFVILIFHLAACEQTCSGGVEIDAILGFWIIGLLGVELQSAWQVASSQIALGRPALASIMHLHVFNPWKRLDLLGILMAVAAGATRLASRNNGAAPEASVRAVTALLLWGRLLTVLSVHWATGPLLASLRRMVGSDLSRYIVFQVLSIVTHAAAFVALYSGEDTDAGLYLGDPLSAIMTLCEQTLPIGDPRSGPLWELIDISDHKGLGWAITGSFGLFSVLLLLNLLIGMLGHSYDRIKSQAAMEYAHGRAREVLHAAALPVVPAPLNLLQIPGAAIYFMFFKPCHEAHEFGSVGDNALHHPRAGDKSASSKNQEGLCEHSLYGGAAPGVQTVNRVERMKLFKRAWEEIGWQIEAEDPWRGSVSKMMAQAEKREQQILARLEAQESLLRRILDTRLAAPLNGASTPGEAQHAALSPAGRPTVQLTFPRSLGPSTRIRTEM